MCVIRRIHVWVCRCHTELDYDVQDGEKNPSQLKRASVHHLHRFIIAQTNVAFRASSGGHCQTWPSTQWDVRFSICLQDFSFFNHTFWQSINSPGRVAMGNAIFRNSSRTFFSTSATVSAAPQHLDVAYSVCRRVFDPQGICPTAGGSRCHTVVAREKKIKKLKQRAPSAALADPWMSRVLQGVMFYRYSGWMRSGVNVLEGGQKNFGGKQPMSANKRKECKVR